MTTQPINTDNPFDADYSGAEYIEPSLTDHAFAVGSLSQSPSSGLSEEAQPLRLKQYGVNDLSSTSETPVFTERMKRFAKQLEDSNIPEHIKDAMMNPIHTNQAGSDAYVKALEEAERAEIDREAEEGVKKYLPNAGHKTTGPWTAGYYYGVVAERSRNINLAAQLFRAKQRIKELETELFKYQSREAE